MSSIFLLYWLSVFVVLKCHPKLGDKWQVRVVDGWLFLTWRRTQEDKFVRGLTSALVLVRPLFSILSDPLFFMDLTLTLSPLPPALSSQYIINRTVSIYKREIWTRFALIDRRRKWKSQVSLCFRGKCQLLTNFLWLHSAKSSIGLSGTFFRMQKKIAFWTSGVAGDLNYSWEKKIWRNCQVEFSELPRNQI